MTFSPHSNFWLTGVFLLACLSSLTPVTPALAQGNYAVTEIQTPEWPGTLHFADMNGDQRMDLIIPRWQQSTGRELLIFLQQANGSYLQQPDRLVEIKPEIIAVALADLRPEPGAELLLFSASAVFSLSSAIPEYSGNLKHLFDWSFVASVPERRETLFFNAVYPTESGQIELLLPGRNGYGVFRSQGDEAFTLIHEFNTVNTDLDAGEIPVGNGGFDTNLEINERDGIVLDVIPRPATAFNEFIVEEDLIIRNNESGPRRPGRIEDDTLLLQTSHWLPMAIRAEMNGDGAADLVYLNIGNDLQPQLNILLQQADGTYPDKPDWQGALNTRGDLNLVDLDGDGLHDLLRIDGEGNSWTASLYRNQGGSFKFATADQVMRFSGYDLELDVVDINTDGVLELSANYYTIPIIDAIRNTSITRTQLLYASAGSSANNTLPFFSARPDFRLDESFSADSVLGLSEPLQLQYDLNADGRNDVLAVNSDGALTARTITEGYRIAEPPFWQYVPSRTITDVDVYQLNGDAIPDLVLFHSTTASILVSRP
ncbi:MAG: VCBS repeat-containing protein [Pseudomonadales bacterium]|nr:VCBS repeat-containing protein [Pseudomonadales bacterium]